MSEYFLLFQVMSD